MNYGFLGSDLPIPKPFHSNPYFFVLWITNLMCVCTIHLVFNLLSTGFIAVMKFIGSLYFKVCAFILCGSHISENGFVLVMISFISYSALNNLVIILLLLHVLILFYRGRQSR